MSTESQRQILRSTIHPNKARIVTTSWDDGNRADLAVAELLAARGMKGTFYIPINYSERSLQNRELRDLSSAGFEIGGHGYSHKLLRGLSANEMNDEIAPCKPVLEDITGMEVGMFCYPCGRYDEKVLEALRAAGYRGARTTRMLAMQAQFDNFEIPTTVQAFPHRPVTYFKNVAKSGQFEYLKTLLSQRTRLGSWVELSKRMFDAVLAEGGVWHLYGHSWEIERLGLWNQLREVLDYVAGHSSVQYAVNGALVPAEAMAARHAMANS